MVNRDFSFVACFFVRLKGLWWFFFSPSSALWFDRLSLQAGVVYWGTHSVPSSHTNMHTYVRFHVPNTCISTSTSVKALSIMVKPNWKGWLACNVLTAYCHLHRGLWGHLTFSCSAHVSWAWRRGRPCWYQLWNEKVVNMSQSREFFHHELCFQCSFFSFLNLHTFWKKKRKILIKCDALTLISHFVPSPPPLSIPLRSHAPFCWTSGGSYWGTEHKPPTGLWGEWVHWCVPIGLRWRPWHQKSCPHDKGMSLKLKILWNIQQRLNTDKHISKCWLVLSYVPGLFWKIGSRNLWMWTTC